MNRYNTNDNRVFARYDGKRALRTTTYPRIPYSVYDVYMVANETDYLDSLATKFYKDSTLWWVIAQANGIKGTLKAPTGKQIRIPRNIDTIIARFNQANAE